ncbi:MAG: rod shape-determining protein MreC [bacterium]|nr:rod shape-determining protein MreC [bacterium]
MNSISTILSKHSTNFHLSLIILLCLSLIIGHSLLGQWSSQVTYTVFHYPFFKARASLEALLKAEEENAELRQALVDASVQVALLEEAQKENQRFRSVLGFEPPAAYEMSPAKIISVSGDVIPTHAVINKGARDSVSLYQAVINQQGLVGRVESVTLDFASVQLLTDAANRVASRLSSSRSMGIAKYGFATGMILDNVPVQSEVIVGDTVLSSGLGGVYPPGLVVGVVREVVRQEEEPFCDISIEPAVDFTTIDELFLLKVAEP